MLHTASTSSSDTVALAGHGDPGSTHRARSRRTREYFLSCRGVAASTSILFRSPHKSTEMQPIYRYSFRLPKRSATRLTNPRPSTKFETTRGARSDSFFSSGRAQPPLGTGKGTHKCALHKCATRPATAAIDSVGPVPPTKIPKCIVIPRRAHSSPSHPTTYFSKDFTLRAASYFFQPSPSSSRVQKRSTKSDQ